MLPISRPEANAYENTQDKVYFLAYLPCFTLNSTMLIHVKIHSTQLQCELCPIDVTKHYNSEYALGIH